jgi:autotransporter-associated beta strand protein
LYGAFTNNANVTLATVGQPVQIAPYNSTFGAQVFNGVISGVGYFNGRGAVTLTGANTFENGSGLSLQLSGNGTTIGIGANSVPTSGGPITSSPVGIGAIAFNTSGSEVGTSTLVAVGGARTIANPLYYTSAGNSATLVFGGSNPLTLSGQIELSLATDTQGSNRTWSVVNTALTTLAGVITDNGLGSGITKTGSGTLALNGANTYTGPTTVSAGTLQVNGSLAAGSAVTVSGGTLAGTGTINGPVTTTVGGALAPGASIGTLTVNNDLTLSGNLVVEVNRSGALSDLVNVSGLLTNGGIGTVTVTNLGANLQTGDTFTLFNKALANGAALTVTGGGSSVTWSNRLAVDGKIQVLSVVATTPTNISYGVAGNNLTLTWPPSHLGWSVQSNAVSVASPANWFAIPGSASATQLVIPINPAQPNVFYRLSLP